MTTHLDTSGNRAGNLIAGLLLILIIATAFYTRVVDPKTLADLHPMPDSGEYCITARNLLESGRFSLDINGAQVPSRYSWGFPLLIIPAYLLSGTECTHAVYTVLACSLLTIVLVFAIGAHFGGIWAGVVSSAIVAASKLDIVLAGKILSDLPNTTVVLLALWLMLCGPAFKRTKRRESVFILLAGIAFGYACWIRIGDLFLLPVLVLSLWLLYPRDTAHLRLSQRLGIFGAAWAVMQIPVLIFNARTFGSPFRTGYTWWVKGLYPDGGPYFSWEYAMRDGQWLQYLRALLGRPGHAVGDPSNTLYPMLVPMLVLVGVVCVLAFGSVCSSCKKRMLRPFLLCGLSMIVTIYACYTFYFFIVDLRFMHLAVPLMAVLAGCGLLRVIGIVCVWRGIQHNKARLCSAAVAVCICFFCVRAAMREHAHTAPAPAQVIAAQMQLVAERTENDALIISDEFEPQYFAGYLREVKNRRVMKFKNPLVNKLYGFEVPALTNASDLPGSWIQQGKSVYFIGASDGGFAQFRGLPQAAAYDLELAFAKPINPDVTASIYRVKLRKQ